jgi:AICAR transformylase/IMP cyclohydrolase PurH
LKDSAAATDSFIFDHENIDILHKLGVSVVIQPTRKLLTTGFLKTDNPIKQAVDDYNMVMLRFFLIGADGQEKAWRVFRHL